MLLLFGYLAFAAAWRFSETIFARESSASRRGECSDEKSPLCRVKKKGSSVGRIFLHATNGSPAMRASLASSSGTLPFRQQAIRRSR